MLSAISVGIANGYADLGADIRLSKDVAGLCSAINGHAITQPLIADIVRLGTQQATSHQRFALGRFAADYEQQIERSRGAVDGSFGSVDAAGISGYIGDSSLRG